MSTEQKQPVYVTDDKRLSVYLETKTVQSGERAGESYSYYNVYCPAEKGGIDIPNRWSGYDISPEEAAELADGHELLIERASKKLSMNPTTGRAEPKRYTQIFSPMPIDVRKGDTQTFRSRKLATGFPTFARDEPETITMITTSNFDASGREIDGTKVSSFRNVGPKNNPIKVTVADLTLALKALAKGETYEKVVEGVGTIPVTGIKQPAEGSKLSPMLEWGRVVFESESAPLPTAGSSGKRR